jgi:hypothetical protein
MTDDELHRLWTVERASLATIAARARTTKHTVGGMVRRLRRAEGVERWPYHEAPIKPPKKRDRNPPKRLKPGTSTLPPLASLEGHGETSRR